MNTLRKRIADACKEEDLDKDSALLYNFWEVVFQLKEKYAVGQDEDNCDKSDSVAYFIISCGKILYDLGYSDGVRIGNGHGEG